MIWKNHLSVRLVHKKTLAADHNPNSARTSMCSAMWSLYNPHFTRQFLASLVWNVLSISRKWSQKLSCKINVVQGFTLQGLGKHLNWNLMQLAKWTSCQLKMSVSLGHGFWMREIKKNFCANHKFVFATTFLWGFSPFHFWVKQRVFDVEHWPKSSCKTADESHPSRCNNFIWKLVLPSKHKKRIPSCFQFAIKFWSRGTGFF